MPSFLQLNPFSWLKIQTITLKPSVKFMWCKFMWCVCVCVYIYIYMRDGSLRTLSNKSFKLNFNLIILSVSQVPLTNAYMDIYQPDQTTGC